MRVKLNRKLCGLLERADQTVCLLRNEKTGHILDTDGIRPHLLNLFRHVHPVLQRICVAQRIGQGNLCMPLFPVACRHRGLKIAQIVQTVKNTDNVNPV